MDDHRFKVGDIVIFTHPIVTGQYTLCRVSEIDSRWAYIHVESFNQTLRKITQWRVLEEYLSPMPCDAHLICTQGEERWLIGWSRERGGLGFKQADRSAVAYKLGTEILRFKPIPIPEKKVETTEVHVGGPYVIRELYDDMKRRYEEERDRGVYLEKQKDAAYEHLNAARETNVTNIDRIRQLEKEVRDQKGFNSVAVQQIEKLKEEVRNQVLRYEKEANVLNQRTEKALDTVKAYQGEMTEAHKTIEVLRARIRVMETASEIVDGCRKDKDFQLDLITAKHQEQHDLMILLKQENVELKARLAQGPIEPLGGQRVVSGATVDRMIDKHRRHVKNLNMAIVGLEKRLEAVQKKAAAANLEKEMLKSRIREMLK